MEITIHNDEPTSEDRLGRDKYATAFARLVETCDTPLVVGLYGTWGVGKTSLMKLIESKVDTQKVSTVWFDPWRHQFDESPALALVHSVVSAFGLQQMAKKHLRIIATAFGSMMLNRTINLSYSDIAQIRERFEDERFEVREARVRLREHFSELIEKAKEKQKRKRKGKRKGKQDHRIIFFIDDLDRCLPEHILKVLESLKLYLNLPGCIYFLGVDRTALERSIKHQYKDLELSESRYLDKIVQLPFTIPPVLLESIADYIQPLLSDGLKPCREVLAKGLGGNPREIKRFVNTLELNHQMALEANIPDYDPRILATVLLIQYRDSDFYALIRTRPNLLRQIVIGEEEVVALRQEYLEKDKRLTEALTYVPIPDGEGLEPYIYLTQLVTVMHEDLEDPRVLDLNAVVSAHNKWLHSDGKEGRRADLSRANLKGAHLGGRDLRNADLSLTNLSNALLSQTVLSESNLRQANLSGGNLSEANASDVDFSDADLTKSDLSGADLSNANLQRAILHETDLSGANLSRADLRGVDFSGTDLTKSDLSGADLSNANLNQAILDETNLSGVNLGGVELSRIDLQKVDLTNADLRHAVLGYALRGGILPDVNLSGVDFSDLDLTKSDLSGADLSNANLQRAILHETDLSGANLSGADLSGANLKQALLDETNLSGANLSGANLSSVDLSGIDLRKVDLTNADLRYAVLGHALRGGILPGANLSEANLSGADLRGANLSGADLSGANLRQAVLEKTNLGGANLRGADLVMSSLVGARLIKADLSGANLSNADLRQARFSRSVLVDANFNGAMLVEATGLTHNQLDDAILDETTILPDLFINPPRRG